MRCVKNSLTTAHVWAFAAMLAAFTAVTLLATSTGGDKGSEHNLRVAQAMLGSITGPLTGAIVRGCQSCCLRFSLHIMAYCAPVLLLGVLAQLLCLPDRRWVRAIRMALWVLGWLVWFLGGILSFGHALC